MACNPVPLSTDCIAMVPSQVPAVMNLAFGVGWFPFPSLLKYGSIRTLKYLSAWENSPVEKMTGQQEPQTPVQWCCVQPSPGTVNGDVQTVASPKPGNSKFRADPGGRRVCHEQVNRYKRKTLSIFLWSPYSGTHTTQNAYTCTLNKQNVNPGTACFVRLSRTMSPHSAYSRVSDAEWRCYLQG